MDYAEQSNPLAFAKLTRADFGLYPVVDSVQWLEKLLPLGVKIIQLRVKNLSGDALKQQISQAIELSRHYPACQLFINDYWLQAIELGAYGVHLGQEDLQTADLSAIAAAGLRLGISTHDPHELETALACQPSYVALGHVFPTQTKDMPSSPQGCSALPQQVARCQQAGCPTVAIGGINLQRAPGVVKTGVNGIAVVTAITLAANWKKAVADFQELFDAD